MVQNVSQLFQNVTRFSDYNPLNRKASSIVLESDLKAKSFRMPQVTQTNSSSSLRQDAEQEELEEQSEEDDAPDIVISNEEVENSVRDITNEEIVESSYSAPSVLSSMTDTPPSNSPISTSALSHAVTKPVRSSRLQNTDQLNAFELISLLNKDCLAPLLGHKVVRKTANMMVYGHPDTVYEDLTNFLQNDKQFSLKQREHDYDMKAVSTGLSDIEFSVKLFVINLELVVVQLSRLRGDTIKFLDLYRSLEERFSTRS
jgi:hypothetical protein